MFEKQAIKSSDLLLVAPWNLWIEHLSDMDAGLAVPRGKTHPPNGLDYGATHKCSLLRVSITSSALCAAQQPHQAITQAALFGLTCLRLRTSLISDALSETT